MSWIREIAPEQAPSELATAYARVQAARGWVANILRVHSVNPAALNAHMALYRTLMFGPSELTRAERESIAVAVSSANACDYCVAHHSHALRAEGGDDVLVEALGRRLDDTPLDARGQALVRHAIKLTRAPAAMTEHDVAALRALGLSHAGIHDATAVAAYFNFVNRMALGLGVALEPEIVA